MGMNGIEHNQMIKIISGDQAGADLAALDFAIKHNYITDRSVPSCSQ